jgi:hypothetical protein
MRLTSPFVALVVLVVGAPVALACSACVKDIMSKEDFDRRSWESASHVFVGFVERAHLQRRERAPSDISYELRAEETFKGDPDQVKRVYSSRMVREWGEPEEVACGDVAVAAGDRVLVFADSEGNASLGRCSATRVIEGVDASSRDDVQATLARLREWREAL